MDHDHTPNVKNKHLTRQFELQSEVQLLLQSGVSQTNIQNVLNHKYHNKFSSSFIYNV